MGGEHEVDRAIAAVCDRATDDFDTLVERLLQAVVAAVPSYAEAHDAGDMQDIRSGLGQGVELCLDCVVDARPPDAGERHALWLIGAQRARQGIPADDLLRVVEVARRVLIDELLTRLGASGMPTNLALEAARLLVTRTEQFTDTITEPLVVGHAHGLEEWFPAGSRRRAMLVDRLLEGRWTSEAEVAEDARAVGRVLGPRTGLFAVVALQKADHAVLLEAAGAVASVLTDGIEGALRFVPIVHVPVVASVAGDDEWQRAVAVVDEAARAHNVAVLVVEPTETAHELVDLYRRAAPVLPRTAVALRGAGVVRLRRVQLLGLLAGDGSLSERMAFVRDVLGPLLALPDADVMLEIIEACHLGTGRLADVARTVHRHENTVRKRLDRIEALTGLSMHVPAQRYELETAVHLHKLLLQELRRLDHRS